MNRRRTVGCVLMLLLTAGFVQAETSGSLPLLKLAPDARAAALGEAGVAGSRGAMAAFHNPALMAFSEGSQASFGYSDWMLDLTMQTASLLFHQDGFVWGLSVNSFSVPGLEQRDVPSDEPIETFSAHDVVGGVSLALPIKHHLAVGITGRYIYQQIYIKEAFGVAGDFGLAYRWDFHELTIAGALRNIGTMRALDTEASPLPENAAFGISGLIYRRGDFGLIGLGDARFFFANDLRFHGGLEGCWKEHIFLRIGYQTGSELRSFSGGAGFAWNRFQFDYAYQPLAEDFSATHRFGFSINF